MMFAHNHAATIYKLKTHADCVMTSSLGASALHLKQREALRKSRNAVAGRGMRLKRCIIVPMARCAATKDSKKTNLERYFCHTSNTTVISRPVRKQHHKGNMRKSRSKRMYTHRMEFCAATSNQKMQHAAWYDPGNTEVLAMMFTIQMQDIIEICPWVQETGS